MSHTTFTDSFGFLLSDVARLLRADFNQRVERLGLTQAQWRAVVHLSRNEGINQVTLADILEIQPITLVRLLDRLEASGLVERRVDPGDRRALRLYLTPAAGPIIESMDEIARDSRAEVLEGITEDEVAKLEGILVRLKENLLKAQKMAGTDARPTGVRAG